MAGIQHRNGSYRVLFRYHGKQYAFTVGKVSNDEVEAMAAHVDYLLMRLEQRLAVVPSGMTIVDYVQFDGKQVEESSVAGKITLTDLRRKYLAANEALLEQTTIEGIQQHFNHLARVLGPLFPIADLSLADLQGYVDNRRTKGKGRNGRKLSAATIEKEIISLRTAWNWAVQMSLVSGKFPNRGLRYPKSQEKPPFMTREEIDRRIAGGGLSPADIADLYDSMYLTSTEVVEWLEFMKTAPAPPYLYPMACFAAYTGARRSEILRTELADVDFGGKIVTIHERKRVRGKLTTRRVPMSPFLINAMHEWLAVHPGTPRLFSQHAVVEKSPSADSDRSRVRATIAGAKEIRKKPLVVIPVTPDSATFQLPAAMSGSKWEVLKGWHVCRHSFISACASKGVDQRLVQSWAGHMSAEMSRRYAYLYPSTQQEALATVFA